MRPIPGCTCGCNNFVGGKDEPGVFEDSYGVVEAHEIELSISETSPGIHELEFTVRVKDTNK